MQFLKTKSKSTLTVLGLTALVISSALWLEDKKNLPGSVAAPSEQLRQADYFMENYNITSTDINGNAFRWLSGTRLAHFPNGDTSLSNPSLQFRQQDQHWLVVAKNGEFKGDKKIILDGDVKIQQLNGRTNILNIKTEHLDISLDENIASTDEKVTVSNENGEINATGMNLNLDQRQLRLLSKVKGRYVFE
ncbi:MAG: LPS export ABC transporter periplasmic protein LptC [Gammaproteobacteria bacterium]|nr:LPS export ABC transporter periplasmic protein LptC [Gammaproteobacteria bacterium]